MIVIIIVILILAAIALVSVWKNSAKRQETDSQPALLTELNTSPINKPLEAAKSNPAVEAQIPEIRAIGDAKVVLIVDDQPAIRMLLREVFELEGIEVYEAPHGRTAIELIKRTRIDFVLLDLKMPDMDGITVLREIREVNKFVKVAMITAYSDPLQRDEAVRLGVLTQFTKPFDIGNVKNFVLSKL
ncbi:CheY-like chemotaxis protein [Paenibacillus phyllosphaerae]|uniref:CheY-like chemotaxis protein n=1 Tax=Paenibacillus phyllosphaerae TaxID=274593 RepID=A0A7W5FMI9_9BACL|nr:response regulator [Paenibacillus phyllosphaerae]MBB3110320.1 CheY-like chemotaxis protein [Paenibacillus phyllosphaerae]